jgi:hypothetical protein
MIPAAHHAQGPTPGADGHRKPMTPPVGFVLLTHTRAAQAHRLVGVLNAMFDLPPIAWHHDFSKADCDAARIGSNVTFVQPHVRTRWGGFSVVEATVRAIRQLYAGGTAGPDYFVVLSGSDYPIKPARTIVQDLQAGECDVYIEYELIDARQFAREWQRECYERYCTKRLPLYPGPALETNERPTLVRTIRRALREIRVRRPALVGRFLPFSEDYRCFAGGQWFAGSRRAAETLIGIDLSRLPLARHYRHVPFSEESFFQCVFANDPGLRLTNRSYRYVDWSAQEAHPKTLGLQDLPTLLASTCHFARKFDASVDAGVLDALDDVVLRQG